MISWSPSLNTHIVVWRNRGYWYQLMLSKSSSGLLTYLTLLFLIYMLYSDKVEFSIRSFGRRNTNYTARRVFHYGCTMDVECQECFPHIHSPLVFENVQTYCTCDWADVGMPDLRDKPHLRDGESHLRISTVTDTFLQAISTRKGMIISNTGSNESLPWVDWMDTSLEF